MLSAQRKTINYENCVNKLGKEKFHFVKNLRQIWKELQLIFQFTSVKTRHFSLLQFWEFLPKKITPFIWKKWYILTLVNTLLLGNFPKKDPFCKHSKKTDRHSKLSEFIRKCPWYALKTGIIGGSLARGFLVFYQRDRKQIKINKFFGRPTFLPRSFQAPILLKPEYFPLDQRLCILQMKFFGETGLKTDLCHGKNFSFKVH